MTDSEQPLAASLARLDAALDEVITAVGEAELSRLSAAGLIEFLHALEQVRNRMTVIDTAAVVDCDRRGIAQLRKDRGTAGARHHATHSGVRYADQPGPGPPRCCYHHRCHHTGAVHRDRPRVERVGPPHRHRTG